MAQLTEDAASAKTSHMLSSYYPGYPQATPSYTSYRYSAVQQNALVLSTYPSSDTRYLCKPIIFNHKTYSKTTYGRECPNVREGTDEDVRRLRTTFEGLGNCDAADVYVDKTVQEIEDILAKACQADLSNYSCLVVIVLTHGEEHLLYAYDKTYPIGLLWKALIKTKRPNPTLAEKPKLFFIQACRGSDLDPGQSQTTMVDYPGTVQKRIPLCADMLIAYSSFLGYKSVRNTMLGSWFIQTLCDSVDMYKDDHDLLTMLTIVQHSVANSKVYQGDKKQIPCVETTLTKKLYLTKKSVIVEPRLMHPRGVTDSTLQGGLQADDQQGEDMESEDPPSIFTNVKWLFVGIAAGICVAWTARKLIK